MSFPRAFIASAALSFAAAMAAPALAAPEGKAWTLVATPARAKPSGFGLSLGRVPEGQELTVLERHGEWARVSDGEDEGWIRSKDLRFETAPEPEAGESSAGGEPVAVEDIVAAAAPREPARTVLPPAPPRTPVRTRPPPVAPLGGASVLTSSSPVSSGSGVSGRWQSAPRVLGLREAPSFRVRMVGSVGRSASVRVLRSESGWGLVESRDGRRGWVVLAALDGPLQR